MKHLIEIPDEIEQALERRALATGNDVPSLIEMALVSFVRSAPPGHHVGRLPDPPLEPVEIVAPCDLPYTDPQPISIQIQSSRQPDPIADPA